MIHTINRDSVLGRVMVLCDFNGKDTKMISLHSDLLYTIEAKDKHIKSLQYEVAWLWQERKGLTGDQRKHIRETADMYRPILALRSVIEPGDEARKLREEQATSDSQYEGP